MASRSEARVFTSIWDDEAFIALPAGRQRMYLFLLSQPDLSYCGLIPLRERRWARKASDLTADQVQAALQGLAEPLPEGLPQGLPEGSGGPLILVDEDTEEVFVRSLIRHDGIWKIPNLLKSAREAATLIESPLILAVLLSELRRIPVEKSDSQHVKRIMADFIVDLEQRLAKGSANPSAKGSVDASGDPSANGSSDPSQGKGEGNGGVGEDSPSPDPQNPVSSSEPEPPTRDLNEGRDDVRRLCKHLADRIEANGSKRPNITKTWLDAARLLLDTDKRTEQQVHAAIDWCQDDEFWRPKVMSMSKLRDKYDQLRLEAKRRKPRGAANGATQEQIRPKDEWMHRQ
jgi:hypothetical protein